MWIEFNSFVIGLLMERIWYRKWKTVQKYVVTVLENCLDSVQALLS